MLTRYAAAFRRVGSVALGLVVLAGTTYIMLIVAGRILGATQFGGIAALYVLISSVSTGLCQPLEQEVARRRGREAGKVGEVDRTLLRRALVFGVGLCAVGVLVALACWPASVRLLGGQPQLLAAFCVALPGYAICFVSRGAFSGSRRLGRYGWQLSIEGAFRLVGLGVVIAVGVATAPAVGWLFALAPWVALAASLIGLKRPRDPRPSGQGDKLVAPLVLLLVSALSVQLLIGAGPVTVQLFADADDKARTGAFLAALVVVRLPVLLFTAVQSSVLPSLAGHYSADRRDRFKALLSKVFAAMGLVALATVVGTTALGPYALKLFFGPDYLLSWSVFLLMGLSVSLFTTATVLAQGLLGLGRHRSVALGWIAGVAGLVAGTFLDDDDAVVRATAGLLGGAALATLVFALLLRQALGQWAPATATAPVDAVPVPVPTT